LHLRVLAGIAAQNLRQQRPCKPIVCDIVLWTL
jgi:hypothetical protein